MLHPRKILITGATGLVGKQVLRHLAMHPVRCFAAVRPGRGEEADFPPGVEAVPFDFADPDTYSAYLGQMDALFLIRPPQLADTSRYFTPLIHRAQDNRLKWTVFLSVQGADRLPFLPHARIEGLIRKSGINHCFLRPSYFMQNFEQALWTDLLERREIVLPAGRTPFLPIDVPDIGAVAARILLSPDEHTGQAYELTGTERLTFGEMAQQLSEALGEPVKYRSPGPFRFYVRQRKHGMPHPRALVMTLLHWLPRFSAAPALSPVVEQILGRPPTPFFAYARRLARRIRAIGSESQLIPPPDRPKPSSSAQPG